MGLLSSVPRLDLPRDRELSVIPGLPPNLALLPKGCAFKDRCKYAVYSCNDAKPKLEEVGERHYAACFRIKEVQELVRAG